MGVKIPLDFTGVPEKGSVRVPEGDYVVKVKNTKKQPAKSSGNPMLVVGLEFAAGTKDIHGKDVGGKSITDRHILVKDSLWTLRNMLEAMGFKVPTGTMKLDTDQIMGKPVGITVIDGEEYKGRIKSEVADYLPASAVGNLARGDEADALSDDDEDDDGLGAFGDDDESDDDTSAEVDEDDESESGDEDEEGDEEEEETLSFDTDDIASADGKTLKAYVKEAKEAGFELELGSKPKVSEVRDALAALFVEDEEEDDEEMEDFSLDDVE